MLDIYSYALKSSRYIAFVWKHYLYSCRFQFFFVIHETWFLRSLLQQYWTPCSRMILIGLPQTNQVLVLSSLWDQILWTDDTERPFVEYCRCWFIDLDWRDLIPLSHWKYINLQLTSIKNLVNFSSVMFSNALKRVFETKFLLRIYIFVKKYTQLMIFWHTTQCLVGGYDVLF